MTNRSLRQVIEDNAPLIVERFVAKARRHRLAPTETPHATVADELLHYLRALARRFETSDSEAADEVAKTHGAQRWDAGYDLESVIREYGVLRSVIIEVAMEAGQTVDARDFETIAEALDDGVAKAAVEFTDQSQEEIRSALAVARSAVEAREEVVAVVSHDLKNPLNVVAVSAATIQAMLTAPKLEAARGPLQNAVGRIERATRRMGALITDLLDLKASREGRLAVRLGEARASHVLERASEDAQPFAEQRSIRILTEPLFDPLVACDEDRILQVFDNLVGNAIKFSPQGATITLSAEASGRECKFAVKDAGSGIPPEQIATLFERFWTAPRRDGRGTGTGLGLAIAKAIVEAHKGRIWVESAVARGTSVFFTLPTIDARAAR